MLPRGGLDGHPPGAVASLLAFIDRKLSLQKGEGDEGSHDERERLLQPDLAVGRAAGHGPGPGPGQGRSGLPPQPQSPRHRTNRDVEEGREAGYDGGDEDREEEDREEEEEDDDYDHEFAVSHLNDHSLYFRDFKSDSDTEAAAGDEERGLRVAEPATIPSTASSSIATVRGARQPVASHSHDHSRHCKKKEKKEKHRSARKPIDHFIERE